MRANKWKKMKTKKAKSLARVGPDDDSNTQRNRRVIYHAAVLLNLQDPAGPPNPLTLSTRRTDITVFWKVIDIFNFIFHHKL